MVIILSGNTPYQISEAIDRYARCDSGQQRGAGRSVMATEAYGHIHEIPLKAARMLPLLPGLSNPPIISLQPHSILSQKFHADKSDKNPYSTEISGNIPELGMKEKCKRLHIWLE